MVSVHQISVEALETSHVRSLSRYLFWCTFSSSSSSSDYYYYYYYYYVDDDYTESNKID